MRTKMQKRLLPLVALLLAISTMLPIAVSADDSDWLVFRVTELILNNPEFGDLNDSIELKVYIVYSNLIG